MRLLGCGLITLFVAGCPGFSLESSESVRIRTINDELKKETNPEKRRALEEERKRLEEKDRGPQPTGAPTRY